MSIAAEHIDALKAILGPGGWKQDADDLAPFLSEWRDRWSGKTPLLALPGSTRQTAQLVRYCARHKIAITPQGGNTGLVGAQIPQGEILLSTARLCQIRALNTDNATLTLDAGVTLADARAAAQNAGFIFPLSLASEGSATIGGILSTNAGGMEVLRYGTARDLALGLEVITPQGDVLSALKGLRKDNTGYDLKQLYIGAEGSLGVITGAVLKLFPIPPIRLSAWCALDTVQEAIALLDFLRQHYGDALCKFELMADICICTALRNIPQTRAPLGTPSPWHVLLDFGFFNAPKGEDALETVLEDAMKKGLISDAVIAQSDTQAQDFLKLRETLSAAQKGEGLAIKHDISVPLSAIADFPRKATKAAEQFAPNCRVFAFGHVGDGNLHFNILQPVQMSQEAFAKRAPQITAAIYDCVHALGGSISAEHGIGIMKKTELAAQKGDVQMGLMRAIKIALDPDNIMNPRVLF